MNTSGHSPLQLEGLHTRLRGGMLPIGTTWPFQSSRITWETHSWDCPCGCFQRRSNEEQRLSGCRIGVIKWSGRPWRGAQMRRSWDELKSKGNPLLISLCFLTLNETWAVPPSPHADTTMPTPTGWTVSSPTMPQNKPVFLYCLCRVLSNKEKQLTRTGWKNFLSSPRQYLGSREFFILASECQKTEQ